MKSPLIHRWGRARERRPQAGVTMILVAMAMVAIIAMAALSIDVVTLYLSRMEAQRAADAGALAAVRVISLSGITGDPSNTSGYWNDICGTSGTATEAAYAAATQTINRVAPTTAQISIKYSANGASPNTSCVGLTNFGINPQVTVQVTRDSLPTFFSRIWGNTGNTVTATAAAEALNPSNSGSVSGSIVPVWPRCVKPWIVPNYDPLNPSSACNTNCANFVDPTTGQIVHRGISLNGGNANGVIGETFWLVADCNQTGGTCPGSVGLRANPPQANYTGPGLPWVQTTPANLLYLPAQAPSTAPVAVPSGPGCTDNGAYWEAIAGCDQTTQYKCGARFANTVDLSENPVSSNDTTDGVACLIHEGSPTASQPDGQDTFDVFAAPSVFPFQIQAGSSNPLGLSGTQITASNSIVSLPIYDQTNPATINGTGTTTVTIVGFLQVFINSVDAWGNVKVTVLNVAGCGNGTNATGTALAGSSPVPVRLITPP
jgi:hypothetical protein